MITTTVVIFVLILILGLFLVSYFFKEDDDASTDIKWYLRISGFLLLLITGLILSISPMQYVVGESVNTTESYIYGNNYDSYHYDDYNESLGPQVMDLNLFHKDITTTTTKVYDDDSSVLSYAFSIILLLAGFLGTMVSINRLQEERYSNDEK